MIYFDLFLGFLKVGLFAFGGAYAAIPMIREVVLSHGWLSDDMLTNMIAISESTPGSIMVNLATYVGSSQAGLPGAVLATLAVILPAFVIILFVMILFKNALGNKYVQAVLRGMKPCLIGIILSMGCYMIVKSCLFPNGETQFDISVIIITAVLALVYFGSRKVLKKGISPILLIAISACVGIAVYGLS